ncbi:MGH1-like glycoside hydrolase domain-containing protein [Catenovulum sediminis]|uniref:Trehalase family glycosidase n=1 Tax=Catenovulum sediminis TaxID=1740262 RepID=A0ABV1RCU5_9ALTE
MKLSTYQSTAKEILKINDFGGYTVPTKGLYPFQWNWDSAITALGWMYVDEKRAWKEIEMLIAGQWQNGMLPHIIFHQESDTYFPGPDVWGAGEKLHSTSISQPPIVASMMLEMAAIATDKQLLESKLKAMLPAIVDYHLWWYRDRDPQNTGLVVSYHPWESGMDNSPAWDDALAAVPQVDWAYQRRDLNHVDSDQRPHKSQYDRYLYLVDFFKKSNFDAQIIYQDCPYKVQDIGIIAMLYKATLDLLTLCQQFNIEHPGLEQLSTELKLTEQAIDQLWSDETQFYHSRNAVTHELCLDQTSAGFMTVYAGLCAPEKTQILTECAQKWANSSQYSLASTIPSSEKYEPQRYWRGPIWLHINWMIAQGFESSNQGFIAEKLQQDARALLEKSGFFEYFHADSGQGCGGDNFSWTAAIALHWLLK